MAPSTTLIAFIGVAAVAFSGVNAQESPYIPSSISNQCSTFLEALDSNPELASCSNRLLSATELFDPSTSTASITSAQIDSTLSSLCGTASSATCSKQLITQHLTWFSGNCTAELAANQPVVRSNYDVLYVLYPFTKAVCAKDSTSGDYCALRINDEEAVEAATSTTPSGTSGTSSNSTTFANSSKSNTTTSAALFIQAPQIVLGNLYLHISDAAKSAVQRLRKRQAQSSGMPNTGAANSTSTTTSTASTSDTDGLLPNATTFRTTNLPFLFLSGQMGQKQLCTDCTKAILASYVGFETDYPYGTGLSSSPILGSQAKLWNEIGGVCGSGFLSAITSQSGNNNFSAAPKGITLAGSSALFVALVAGLAFVF